LHALRLAVLDEAPECEAPEVAVRQWTSLDVIDVAHVYSREQETETARVGPISLTLRPGTLTFVVGGNGSGKSTLVKLIAGLYEPEAGQILLDGVEINGDNRDWYRQHFAVIYGDFYLFGDLRPLGVHDLEKRALEYLKALKLDAKVRIENGAFSTLHLSQGQRKRLALVVAYLEDRPIYIFDEWASDQDPSFKRIFYTRLLPELKQRGKAVLVVTHDDGYFHLADEIIKLEDGRVAKDTSGQFFMRLGVR
jgi:putative ATP-binding cassette transporter